MTQRGPGRASRAAVPLEMVVAADAQTLTHKLVTGNG